MPGLRTVPIWLASLAFSAVPLMSLLRGLMCSSWVPRWGVMNHEIAAQIQDASAVVACGRIPVTARALAVLRRNGVAVPADFVALAGSALALWGDPTRTEPEILAAVRETVGVLSSEFTTHADGPFLAACLAAESYLSTWQDELPLRPALSPLGPEWRSDQQGSISSTTPSGSAREFSLKRRYARTVCNHHSLNQYDFHAFRRAAGIESFERVRCYVCKVP